MSQPQPTIFFVDRCLGSKTVPQALRKSGAIVEFHDDHFAKDAKDTEWLPEVGKKGWIVLTKDAHIGKRTLERIAVTRAGIRMFVLASQNLSGADMAEIFKQAIRPMQEFAQANPAPFIAKVYREGRVEEWKNQEELLAEIAQPPDPSSP